jgi:signal peptidase I
MVIFGTLFKVFICMANLVSQRFVQCIDDLKSRNIIKSLRQMALACEYAPQNFNDIYNGKRDVTIDLLMSALRIYGMNPNYLFTGLEPKFNSDSDATAAANLEKIIYVPMAAHAGYAEQFTNPVFMSELVRFSLPDYKFLHGTYRCFDVVGDSMEPSLYAGDKVVCSPVEITYHMSGIRSNHVYVVVFNDGVIVKRLIKSQDPGKLTCISDNDYYNPTVINLEDVKEIWYVEVKISPFLPSPLNIRHAFHAEMDAMKQLVKSQSDSIDSLNQTIEKLLKQSRS